MHKYSNHPKTRQGVQQETHICAAAPVHHLYRRVQAQCLITAGLNHHACTIKAAETEQSVAIAPVDHAHWGVQAQRLLEACLSHHQARQVRQRQLSTTSQHSLHAEGEGQHIVNRSTW
jgi:hypothetical protein